MPNSELKNYVKSMLGDDYVEVELTDETLNIIIKQALDKIAPFYDGRRYILGEGKVVDLSDHASAIKEILHVYNTKNANIYSLQEYVFGGNGIMIYSSRLMDRLQLYNCYKMLSNELNYTKDVNFRYMKPNLYLDDYERSVVIEALVRPEDLTDIDPSSEYYAWVKDYTLALAKETIGRVRSKFQVDGSPYQLDGERLLSEAQSMKTELENKLTGTIFVI